MKLKRVLINITFIVLCFGLIFASGYFLRGILNGNAGSIGISVDNSFLNFLIFCIPGLLLVAGLIFAGGYKLFFVTTDNIDNSSYKAFFKRFIPRLNKKSLIISLAIILIVPFLCEMIFTIMELSAPTSKGVHTYSITNVLKWMLLFTIVVYLVLLYKSPLTEKEEKKERLKFTDENLKFYDYIVFGVLATICFFFFVNADLSLTSCFSYGILSGNIADFYDYIDSFGMGQANYMITTYLVFAIWNVPVRLITGGKYYYPSGFTTSIILYNKLLLVIVFLFSVSIVFKICKQSGMDVKRARLGAYLYACSPISIFAIFIFGQYDIFGLFCLLVSIYFLQKNRDVYSALLIGIGITCKITVLIVYIPILLMLRKDILRIIGILIITLLPYALLTVYYSGQAVFREKVSGFGALTYIIASRISIMAEPPIEIYIFVFLFIIACGFCFFQKKRETKDEIYHGIVTGGAIASFCFFGMCFHHPQWFIIAAPFFALLTLEAKKIREFSLIIVLAYTAYLAWVLVTWVQNVDTHMMVYGILAPYLQGIFVLSPVYVLKLQNFLFSFENIRSTYFTIYSVLLFICVYIGIRYQRPVSDNDEMKERYRLARGVMIIPSLFYVSLCFMTLLLTVSNI